MDKTKYNDSINLEELSLFTKYNNANERSFRHIDTYTIDYDQMAMYEIEKYSNLNQENLKKDFEDQLRNHSEKFR